MWKKLAIVGLLSGLCVGAFVALERGDVDRWRQRLWKQPARFSAADFPAGVTAPIDQSVSVPLRATRIGFVVRPAVAALLWAAGDKAQGGKNEGTFRSAYAMDVEAKVFDRDDQVETAFLRGGDVQGGIDAAVFTAAQVGLHFAVLREAVPRTVLLLSRSRGEEVLVAKSGIRTIAALKNQKLGVVFGGPAEYFAWWAMSSAALSAKDVVWVGLDQKLTAAQALKTSQVDAVVGYPAELDASVKQEGAHVLSSTIDAPHLVAYVLVFRGDYAARYPDAVRRVTRGALDASAAALNPNDEVARYFGEVAPAFGDPREALPTAPVATLQDNLVFFGLAGEAPVKYADMFRSGAVIASKLYGTAKAPEAAETVDLDPLKFISSSRGL